MHQLPLPVQFQNSLTRDHVIQVTRIREPHQNVCIE